MAGGYLRGKTGNILARCLLKEPIVMEFAIRKLHHFAWRCKDAQVTRQFYENLLGLPLAHVIRADHVPSTGEYCPYVHIFFQMKDGSFIAFFDLGDNTAATPSANTPAWVNHIALEVGSVEELLSAKERLEKAGVDVLGITDHKIIDSIYFFDPNGLRVELTTKMVPECVMEQHARKADEAFNAWLDEKRQRATRTKAAE
jgi:catechol 2,3-dioxygenase-like lactoylglutathione lyase family enzyme